MFDNLTGLTGMDAPALDGGDAPVVRYQDLQRGHSPASAGAPALNANYAPEVIEAAEEISEIGYGPSPLEIPSYVVPYYGRPQMGYGAGTLTAEEVKNYPTLKRGSSEKTWVTTLQTLLVSEGVLTQANMNTGPGIFGNNTELAVGKFQRARGLPVTGVVDTATWLALYDLDKASPNTARTNAESKDAATKGVKGTTGEDARSGAAKGAAAFLEAFNIGAGYKEDPKKKFEVSNYSEQYGEGTDWGKIALWGGVAVAGIVATVLVVRAVRSKE